MKSNVELKARLRVAQRQGLRVARLATSKPQHMQQVDTFFHVASGRLKLRELAADRAELIYYHRPDGPGPTLSSYTRVKTDEPGLLKQLLTQALGVRGVVRKDRVLYWVDQTRVHLDDVYDLGNFIELEVVLRDGQTMEEGNRIAMEIMGQLDIHEDDLIDCAYIDLLDHVQGCDEAAELRSES